MKWQTTLVLYKLSSNPTFLNLAMMLLHWLGIHFVLLLSKWMTSFKMNLLILEMIQAVVTYLQMCLSLNSGSKCPHDIHKSAEIVL